MTGTKAPARPATAVPIEDDERHLPDVDAFIERNREALNESLRQAREQLAKGQISTKDLGTIIAEGRKRHAG